MDLSLPVADRAMLHADNAYWLEHIRITSHRLTTHTPSATAFRGFGAPQAMFVMESAISRAAEAMSIDRVEIRRRNMISPDMFPHETPVGLTYDSGEFAAVMDEALKKADYQGYAARKAATEAAGKLRGIGISCTIEQAAGPSTETAELRFDPSGTAIILAGSTPHGQGHETSWSMIASEQTGIPMDKITLVWGDTDLVPEGGGTMGSRSLQHGGAAVNKAAIELVDKAKQLAAKLVPNRQDMAFRMKKLRKRFATEYGFNHDGSMQDPVAIEAGTEGAHAEDRGFHGGRDGSGIGHVFAQVGAMIDTGKH